MCKKTLSIFGSGSSSVFLLAFYLFLDSPVSVDFISPLLTVEHEFVCACVRVHDLVYLFSRYFLSPFSVFPFSLYRDNLHASQMESCK